MSSISSLSSAIQPSPKQRLLDSISSSVSAGSISSTDQTALDGAVNDIDTALTSGKSSSSAPPDPSQIKTKIDGLIDNEVSSGKLTSDQASTLKQVFSQSGGHHAHKAHGAGGPPPASPQPDGTDDSSANGDPTPSGSTGSNVSDLLASFLKDLQSSQTAASGYGATGTSGSTAAANSLIFNFSA